MSIQKHADALKLKDSARSPNSSLVGSNNASREQMPSTGNAESNRISTSDMPSSKQQPSSERITFNPNDKFKNQQQFSPGAYAENENGTSINQNKLFYLDS